MLQFCDGKFFGILLLTLFILLFLIGTCICCCHAKLWIKMPPSTIEQTQEMMENSKPLKIDPEYGHPKPNFIWS